MNCPKCNKYIEDNLTVCPYCRNRLTDALIVDTDFVIGEIEAPREQVQRPDTNAEEEMVLGVSEKDMPREKKQIPKIYLFVNAALIVCVGVVAFWMATHQSNNMTALYTPTDATQPTINAAVLAEIPTTEAATDAAGTPRAGLPNAGAPTTVPATTRPQASTAASTTAASTTAPASTAATSGRSSGGGSNNPVVPREVQTIYFDNNAYNWSQVIVYAYTPGSSSGSGTWVSSAMTRGADNVYSYTIPSGLENGLCYFVEQSGSTERRYPPGQDTGLPLNGKSMILKGDYAWEEYNGSKPATRPTEPTQPTQPPAGKVLIGDIDLNGFITIKDATLLQLHLAYMETLSGDALIAADLDKNKTVNIQDITLLQRYLAGFEDSGNYCGTYTDNFETATRAVETTGLTESTELTEATERTDATVGFKCIYYKNNDGWSTVFAHVRNSSDTASDGFDVPMADLGNDIWVAEFADGCDAIAFNNGGSLQTDEVYIPESRQIYDDGVWIPFDSPVPVTEYTTSAPIDSVMLNPDACSNGEEVWYAWTWGVGNYRWVKGEKSGSGYVFNNIDFSVVFVRMNGDKADWSNVLNQTDSLITQKGCTYTITGWGSGNLMKGSW